MTTHPVFQFADDLTELRADLEPSFATYYGVQGRDDRWEDFGPDGIAARHQALRERRRLLDELPAAEEHWSSVAVRAIGDALDQMLARFDDGYHLRNLNSVACPLQHIRQMADLADKASVGGWNDLIARLATMDRALAGYRNALELGRGKGLAVARRQVEAAAQQARIAAGDTSPFEALGAELEDHGLADGGRADAVAAGVHTARRAYGELAEYLEQVYLPSAPEEDAVGRDRYLPAARFFLGAEVDPDETYAWGWDEVERLRTAMEAIAGGLYPGASLTEVLARLDGDPAMRTGSREEFVALMAERLTQAVADLDGSVFDIPEPVKEVTVQVAPEGGPLGAYYVGPTEDWSRPGSVWFSLAPDEHRVGIFNNVSTNYHEGFPGHHLQLGIQLSLAERLSRYHRSFVWWSGYGEGWALYAERLMHELGYLERPEYELGYLAESMLRACRVAIDIGCHLGLPIPEGQPFHPGETWSFDLGVEMLERYAAQKPAYARSEMTRYLGWPGQAISYKVGEREILDLREQRRTRGGLDLKQFHAAVLSHPVGLDHLRAVVMET